jgi:hypothetical protein
MKRLLAPMLGLALTLGLGGQVSADTQMTVSVTNYTHDAYQAMPIDKDHVVLTLEQFGVQLAESEKGPLNNLSSHGALIVYVDKGARHFHGYYTYVDKDGDNIVWEIWDFPYGTPDRGTGKIIDATGKYTGMEGTAENIVIQHLKSWPAGTGRSIAKMVWKLTLKNPLE